MYRRVGDSIHFSYLNPDTGVQVVAMYVGREADALARLSEAGFETMKGTWVTEASLELLAQLSGETFVAAVAYETKRGPGLWMDGYPYPPTEAVVLRAIFEEFVSEGYLGEGDFEVFLSEAKPIVQILSPADLERFIKQKASN